MGFCSFCTGHNPPYNSTCFRQESVSVELSWCQACLLEINDITKNVASAIHIKWKERISFIDDKKLTKDQQEQLYRLSKLLSLTPTQVKKMAQDQVTHAKYKEVELEFAKRGRELFLAKIDWSFTPQNEETIKQGVEAKILHLLQRVSWAE